MPNLPKPTNSQEIRKRINWLTRDEIQMLLEGNGYGVYDNEPTEDLKEALFQAVEAGEISLEYDYGDDVDSQQHFSHKNPHGFDLEELQDDLDHNASLQLTAKDIDVMWSELISTAENISILAENVKNSYKDLPGQLAQSALEFVDRFDELNQWVSGGGPLPGQIQEVQQTTIAAIHVANALDLLA